MRRSLLILTLAAFCGPAWAQKPHGPAAAKPEAPAAPAAPAEPQRTTATFADWTLRCVRPEGAVSACEITQTIFDKNNPVAQTAIGRPGKAEALRLTILVPANIQLAAGPKFQPGEGEPGIDLTWRRCLPAGCLADTALTDDQLKKLRARVDNGRIVFQDGTGRDTVIPFAPKGLGPALDALAKES